MALKAQWDLALVPRVLDSLNNDLCQHKLLTQPFKRLSQGSFLETFPPLLPIHAALLPGDNYSFLRSCQSAFGGTCHSPRTVQGLRSHVRWGGTEAYKDLAFTQDTWLT